MTIAHNRGDYTLVRSKWRCDVCGKVDFWKTSWIGYYSLALEEACPEDIPTACSKKCYAELLEKIERNYFVLPGTRFTPGGCAKTTDRKGY